MENNREKAAKLLVYIFAEFQANYKVALDVSVIQDVVSELISDQARDYVRNYVTHLTLDQLLAVLDETNTLTEEKDKLIVKRKKKGIH